MAVKSNKDTMINKRFKAALNRQVAALGKTQLEAALKLQVAPGTLNNLLKKGASAAMMESIADRLGLDLLDLLGEGRAILAGETSAGQSFETRADRKATPNKREIELLRKLEIANDEARTWRLRVEELERKLRCLSDATAKVVALEGTFLADLNSTAALESGKRSSEER